MALLISISGDKDVLGAEEPFEVTDFTGDCVEPGYRLFKISARACTAVFSRRRISRIYSST